MPDEKSIFSDDVESLATLDAALDHFVAALNGTVLEITIPWLKDPITVTITTPHGPK